MAQSNDQATPPFLTNPPLAEDDYPFANIRLATHFDRERTTARLVFAAVELLPQPFSAPETTAIEPFDARGAAKGTLYFRRVAMLGAEALRWYRLALAGAMTTPIPLRPEDRGRADGRPLSSQPFTSEPPWPELGLYVGSERDEGLRYELPFLSDWHEQPRIHRALASPHEVVAAVTSDARNRDWLLERISVDLGTHPEWIGGLALIAPNPIWRRLERRLLRPSAHGVAERTLLNAVLRPGASTASLEALSFQERAGLVTRLQRRSFQDTRPFLVFDHGASLRAEGLLILCGQRGPLFWSRPAPFVRSIALRSSITSEVRRYTTPVSRSAGGKTETFDVPSIVDEARIIGEPPLARDEVVETAARRGRQRVAERYGQKWFADDHEAAAAFLRSLIGAARETVGIFDPYVTGLELLRFAHAVTRASVTTRILTSALPFHQTDKALEHDRLAEVEREVARLRDRRVTPERVQVRVMKGDPPSLHDRFLIVDGDVWFTGNSLGTLGDRAGMIIRLPDPEPVLQALDRLFDDAEEVEVFVARRRSALAASAPAAAPNDPAEEA